MKAAELSGLRYRELEERLQATGTTPDNFVDELLFREQSKYEKKKKKKLQDAYDHFHSRLLRHLGDCERVSDCLLLVLQYSIIYTEIFRNSVIF